MPSPEFIETVTASAADDVYLVLIRLACPEFPDWSSLFRDDPDADELPTDWPSHTLCFAANDEPVLSNNITHIPWGFEFIRPPQGVGGPARLRMDNVDRRIFDAIKLLPSTAKIAVECDIVVAAHPDEVEIPYSGFDLKGVTGTDVALVGDLTAFNDDNEPFCSISYRRFNAPGIFA